MTKESILSKDTIENMNTTQKELYLKSLTFPDKISLYDFHSAALLISQGLYPWGSSTRVYVPKPGVLDKQRPITIPPFMDRIVQKALCLVLESIFEPYFELLNRSFGFRPNKGVHDAISAFETNYTNGMRIAIEGDVEAAFDTVVRAILLETLGKKIIDKQFLKFIEQRLEYDYVETIDGKQVRTRPTLGIPQGGINSPYLFNIYMSNLDEYIEYNLTNFLETKNQFEEKRQGGKFTQCP
jgi:retron-type reverse transcriptase